MSYSSLRIGRVSIPGQVYLVTTVTAGRHCWFADLYLGRIVVCAMRSLDMERVTHTLAFVVMPDHVYWLLELRGTASLSAIIQLFKGRCVRVLNGRLRRHASVWQPAFHDHAVRNDESLRMPARYVIMNPVRAGLVKRVGDYSLWDAVWVLGNDFASL